MVPYTDLCKLSEKYGTDKRPEPLGHGYTHYYHELFSERRYTVSKVLEIGIDVGASLRMWKDYFPNARIYALDCDSTKFVSDHRIASFYCDQSNEASLRSVAREFILGKNFDFIIDDGSHVPKDQILSAKVLVPLLATGGIYVIEDVLDPEIVIASIPYKCEVKEFEVSRDPYSKLVVIRG